MEQPRSAPYRPLRAPQTAAAPPHTADLILASRRERRRHALGLLALTGRVWVRIILPLLFVTTCGAAVVMPCGMFGPVAKCRSRQSEGRTNLKALFVAQTMFRADNGRYARTLPELGFQPRGEHPRYRYVIEEAAGDTFSALAIALEPESLAGDVWRIDDNNQLENLVNACAR